MTTVQDVMSAQLVSISATASVAEAATIMGERQIGSILVLEGESLAGIFTERDIVRALSQHHDAAGHPLGDWMTRDPVTVTSDTPVQDALDRMLSGGFRHLPVMEGDSVIGVVSIRDLSRATSET